jgi:hypothetical protein
MDLEQEIAVALTGETTSVELAQLIDRVTTAASAAGEEAAQERKRALDPAVLVDTQAVSAAVINAELRRDRFDAALPRLQQRYTKAEAAERYVSWVADFEAAKAERDAAAAELSTLYPVFAVKLGDLLQRIEAVDAQVRRVNSAKPMDADRANGDGLYCIRSKLQHGDPRGSTGLSYSVM